MFSRRVPLSLAMKLIALVALDLAFVRVLPAVPQSPILLFALVMINVLIVQSVILARPLNAFHTTFFVVGFVASIALSVFPQANRPPGSLHILASLIALVQQVAGEPPRPLLRLVPYLPIAERWLTSALGVVVACAAGVGMARLERRSRDAYRRVLSFVQGGAIGLGLFTTLGIAYACMVRSPMPVSLACWGFAICLLGGGATVVLVGERRRAAETTARP